MIEIVIALIAIAVFFTCLLSLVTYWANKEMGYRYDSGLSEYLIEGTLAGDIKWKLTYNNVLEAADTLNGFYLHYSTTTKMLYLNTSRYPMVTDNQVYVPTRKLKLMLKSEVDIQTLNVDWRGR